MIRTYALYDRSKVVLGILYLIGTAGTVFTLVRSHFPTLPAHICPPSDERTANTMLFSVVSGLS